MTRITEIIGYSAETSAPDERPSWGHFTVTYIDSIQPEFDRWLQSVKADAWDEGYGLGIEVGHRGDDYWETNPYRKEA